MEKCPLCGGTVIGKVCGDCGYELPDYAKMSAPYDLDPSNDLFGAAGQEPEFPSIEPIGTPEPEMQSISTPRVAPPPNVKAAPPPPNVKAAPPPPNIKVQPPPAPPAQKFSPPPLSMQQYYVQPNLPPPTLGDKIRFAVTDFFKAHWWQILAMLIVPWSGYIFGSYYGEKGKKEGSIGKKLLAAAFFIAATVLTFWRYSGQ